MTKNIPIGTEFDGEAPWNEKKYTDYRCPFCNCTHLDIFGCRCVCGNCMYEGDNIDFEEAAEKYNDWPDVAD